MFQLTHALSRALETMWVMGERPKAEAEARLLMYHVVRVTLGSAMRALSLRPLDRI